MHLSIHPFDDELLSRGHASMVVVVEPACGAALAAIYANVEEIREFKMVAVIVCGGVTATMEQLQKWSSD